MTIPYIDWTYCSNRVVFGPVYSVSEPRFGQQRNSILSPFWQCDLIMPPKKLDVYREIEAKFAETEGFGVVNVFDPRFPYPGHWKSIAKHNNAASSIPDITISDTSIANSQITITGTNGDMVHVGDPLAFTHNDKRYYFKARQDLELDGTAQTLDVYLRPREDLTGLAIVLDRVRPTMRFAVDINGATGRTENTFTEFNLRGVEFWHAAPGLP